jgi:hypothetical protein
MKAFLRARDAKNGNQLVDRNAPAGKEGEQHENFLPFAGIIRIRF